MVLGPSHPRLHHRGGREAQGDLSRVGEEARPVRARVVELDEGEPAVPQHAYLWTGQGDTSPPTVLSFLPSNPTIVQTESYPLVESVAKALEEEGLHTVKIIRYH
jgi:hypothetical protein